MSEKRFKEDYEVGVLDTLTDEIICDCQGSAEEVVELLNTQQATITQLKEENEQLKKQNIEYEEVQCKIMNYIIDKGLGSEFAKFLRECCDE